MKKGKGSEWSTYGITEARARDGTLEKSSPSLGKLHGECVVRGGWIRFDVAIWGFVEGGEPEMERLGTGRNEVFQTRTVPSSEPEATCEPSGEKLTAKIRPL